MDIEKISEELTVEEKAALVAGTNFMYTNPVPRLFVPSVRMADGPHGLRVQDGSGDNGVAVSNPATAFPAAATLAASWNVDNACKVGEAIAQEALHYGINILLGPGANIKRNPLCGRNFEYFSEDPYLAGKMAAAEVNGVQSKNVGVAVKHFALNNAEKFRFTGDSVCDMRAMREIYLKAFEIIVKESKPHSIMCAYNKINGEYCSENKWLLTDVLRNEWGFDGLVMSDWGATHDRVKGVAAGLDLEMPGDTAICRKRLVDGVADGTLSPSDLNKAAKNVLKLVGRYENAPKAEGADFEAHHALAAEIAADCAVLLKNDGMLPLRAGKKLFIAGDLFEKTRYQGAGSSMINPAYLSSPKAAFDERGVAYKFCRGYDEGKLKPNKKLLAEAVAGSEGFDEALVFAGLTDYVEGEGADRENMRLPENQLALVDALVAAGKRVGVVLYGGSPAELPFADKISALLDMYLPGQNGGTAAYDLLFGVKSPCGKLAETWATSYDDVPFGKAFSKTANEIYKESVFVGYRYYLAAGKKVRYPFGFGLSYTSFKYGEAELKETRNEISIGCEIQNVGEFDGAEIVQLYVKAPRGVFKPPKELKGFAKIYLKAGERGRAEITVRKDDLRYWNVKENGWATEGGEYEFQLCSDCQTVKASRTITLDGDGAQPPYEDEINALYSAANFDKVTDETFERMSGLKIPPLPPKKPIGLESRFDALRRSSIMGKILYKGVMSIARKELKKAKKLSVERGRDNGIKGALFLRRVLESSSLISMSMSGGKRFPYNFAQGFVHFANGSPLKGIKCFRTKIEAPPLPKDKPSLDVVAALIRRGVRFLICRRPPDKARGLLWEFAGGKVERGETPKRAIIRECGEELGITVEPKEIFIEVTHEYPDVKVRLTVFECRISRGEPRLLEHIEMRWIEPTEISNFEFCPADAEILARIKSSF